MKKSDAIKLFGGNNKLAKALGKTPGAVSQWTEEMSEQRINEIIGCAARKGINVPSEFLK
jgi:transcriptional repressor of cell division inhibition gene dicB